MNGLGFIGFGSMGSMLAREFINSGAVSQEQIIITRKDKGRLGEVKEIWENANIAGHISEVIENAKYIFICVKPIEYKNVLEEIKPHISKEQHIVSIAGTVAIKDI